MLRKMLKSEVAAGRHRGACEVGDTAAAVTQEAVEHGGEGQANNGAEKEDG
jgi:hypothetical protein